MENAKTYARVIVNELNLPLEQKTLQPVHLGGVLGGSKYLVRGVLFKIPDGSLFKDYPDPIAVAQKISGHEMKGLKAYFSGVFEGNNQESDPHVSFPLACVIEYKVWKRCVAWFRMCNSFLSLSFGRACACWP